MSDDYRIKGRSNLEVRELAKKTRDFFDISGCGRVDILTCLTSPTIRTVRGIQRLNFQVRPDSEMGVNDGETSYGKGIVTIAVKQSVRNMALVGDGRARHTLAHELGHAVMHDGVHMSRRAAGNVTPKWIKPFESAEHQAKVFAAAFLINDVIANTLSSAEEVSVEFGVSLESAKIFYEELIEQRNREKTADNIRRMADEFRALIAPAPPKVRYIKEPCAVCGNPTVFPLGIKFMCETCDTVSDRFQDGDSLDL